MNCPSCGLTNPNEAQRCDCGFDFIAKVRRGPVYRAESVFLWRTDLAGAATIFFLIVAVVAAAAYALYKMYSACCSG